MLRGIYSAASGMLADQRRLDVIANNLANASTSGFKRDASVTQSFQDLLVVRVGDRAPVADAQQNMIGRVGFGTLLSVTAARLTSGAMKQTGNPLDVAISGDGFFVVNTDRGLRFTRNGSFRQAADGTLVTQEGHQVMVDGQAVQGEAGTLRIDERGRVFAAGQELGTLTVIAGADVGSIRKEGGNLWTPVGPNEPSGLIPSGDANAPHELHVGYLEASNVESVTEMVEMMTTMRSFEANQKSIQAQDEALGRAVTEIGRIG